MISMNMQEQVQSSSVIRAMFEEGKRLAAIHGEENVFDFSLGNPNVEPPEEVNQAILEILKTENLMSIHGYMNNSGYEEVRAAIAKSINAKFDTAFTQENILMTVGAAGGLNVIFKTLLNPKDEVITFAPFFGEYRSYVKNYGGELVVISPNMIDFQPNLGEFRTKITPLTKAVIINSPNNPTGVIYSEATIIKLSEILREKQKEFGTDIYLVSDEPYRELTYDNAEVPYLSKYYANTIIGYSFSKSLSLPGERIGYLVIPDQAADYEEIITAANIANRILGFVNAPSLFQRVVARCLSAKADVETYNRNRELLYNGLSSLGYQCIKPAGAFYMFVKTPIESDVEFCNLAKQKNILIVPGTTFGCPGYVRIAYCVAYSTIEKALPGFKALIEELKITGKNTHMDYNFEIIETAAQPALSIRTVTSVGNLPQKLGKAYNSIIAYLLENGEQPADTAFAAYYNMDMENLEVEMGFPVAKALAGQGEISASQVPAGKKAVYMYKGAYQEMAPVYEAMAKWINDNGYQPTGVVYEFYYNSLMEVPESELLTKIVFLLK